MEHWKEVLWVVGGLWVWEKWVREHWHSLWHWVKSWWH